MKLKMTCQSSLVFKYIDKGACISLFSHQFKMHLSTDDNVARNWKVTWSFNDFSLADILLILWEWISRAAVYTLNLPCLLIAFEVSCVYSTKRSNGIPVKFIWGNYLFQPSFHYGTKLSINVYLFRHMYFTRNEKCSEFFTNQNQGNTFFVHSQCLVKYFKHSGTWSVGMFISTHGVIHLP